MKSERGEVIRLVAAISNQAERHIKEKRALTDRITALEAERDEANRRSRTYDTANTKLVAERNQWKSNAQRCVVALNMVEEAFGQLLPGEIKSGHHRGPDPVEQAECIIETMHRVREQIAGGET